MYIQNTNWKNGSYKVNHFIEVANFVRRMDFFFNFMKILLAII